MSPGSMIAQLSLANQFTGKDPSADAAVSYAVSNAHVQHIVILGHYGCRSVHAAMSPEHMSLTSQAWLQPVADLLGRSKRPEIKSLVRARRFHDDAGAAAAEGDAFRALVEENVKAAVNNLQTKSILAAAYNKRNRNPELQFKVFVHGLVVDEESGEVKDLNVSFGPWGEPIPKILFDVVVPPTVHNSFGKFNPKAKRVKATSSPTTASTTALYSSPTES